MEFRILRRFYSNIEANIYLIKLKEGGINCFLSSENISTILPLSDGGVLLNVAEDQLEEAVDLLAQINAEEMEVVQNEDFRDATKEDIYYTKKVKDREQWLNGGWVNMDIVSSGLVVAFILVVIFVVINYFYPFS